MVRPDQDPIGGDWWVEADETLVGGKTRGEGHGVHHMTYVVGVVDIRESIDKHGGKNMYAGRIRLQVLDDRTGESLEAFVSKNVAPHSHIL